MDTDSFSSKLLLMFIDKAIIGLFITVVVLGWQYQQQLAERRTAYAQVSSSIMAEHVAEVAETVKEYLRILETLKGHGQARGRTANRLRDLYAR